MWVMLGPESLPEPTSRPEQAERSGALQIYKLPARVFIGAGTGYNRKEREDKGSWVWWRSWTAGVMFPCPCVRVDDPKPHVCKCHL